MRNRLQVVVTLQVIATLLSVSFILASSDAHGQEAAKSKNAVVPLSLRMSTVGRFSKGYAWHLEASSAEQASGQAHLSIESYPEPKSRQFEVSEAQLAALREALIPERFFELGQEYGGRVPDGNTRSITIIQGKKSHTVTLHFLRKGDAKAAEVQRALRVWHLIRSWFDDAEAVDLRPYDQSILSETN